MPYRMASALLVAFASVGSLAAADKPLKVYILAGQSNMQGHASISTFDSMADDPKTAQLLKEMRGPDGKPKVCENVWISSIGCLGDAYTDLREKKGKLTAGFGAPTDKIGPEFTFGITMEKLLGEPVLIIKTSWGGRSLHTDFRPPSAGPYAWSDYELTQLKRRGDDLEKSKVEKAKATGVYYREMMAHVQKVLKDIKRVVPDYDEKQGYELGGFVWFQGFNDYVSSWTYDKQMKPGGYDLYGELLAHLAVEVIRDLVSLKKFDEAATRFREGLKAAEQTDRTRILNAYIFAMLGEKKAPEAYEAVPQEFRTAAGDVAALELLLTEQMKQSGGLWMYYYDEDFV